MVAVIFDMDGVLIDSEPLWREAEKKTFSTVGISLSTQMCLETMGLRIDEVVHHWYEYQPWTNKTKQQVVDELLDNVVHAIKEKGQALPGVIDTLRVLSHRDYKIGLASSSPLKLIEAVVDKLEITHHFECLCSAEHEAFGKPHPGVYLTAAKALEALPQHCIAVEDSVAGVISAKAAKMTVVAIPETMMRQDPRFAIADAILESMEVMAELPLFEHR